MADFSILTANCLNGGIGKDGKLPWPFLKDDYDYYIGKLRSVKKEGNKNVSIYGLTTWNSAGKDETSSAINVVISRSLKEKPEDAAFITQSFDEALQYAKNYSANGVQVENVYVLGGQQLYETSIKHPNCKRIYKTQIMKDFDCDRFFPEIPGTFQDPTFPDGNPDVFRENNGVKYRFEVYDKKYEK